MYTLMVMYIYVHTHGDVHLANYIYISWCVHIIVHLMSVEYNIHPWCVHICTSMVCIICTSHGVYYMYISWCVYTSHGVYYMYIACRCIIIHTHGDVLYVHRMVCTYMYTLMVMYIYVHTMVMYYMYIWCVLYVHTHGDVL